MFGIISNDENKLFISGQEILGVENVELSYSNSSSIAKYLGIGIGHTVVTGPSQQKMSVARNLIYQDPILNYTGNAQMSGSLNYDGDSYGFKSGFLDEYMVNCAVGSVPKVNCNVTIYDQMERSSKNMAGSSSIDNFYIPNQGSILLSCDNSSTNRVIGFDYSIKCTRRPIYKIGSKFPTEVSLVGPLEFAASVQIDVDDAFLSNSMAFLTQRQNKTVNFAVKSRDHSIILQQISIPNASLVGETLSSSADGGIKMTLNYIGHL